LPKESQDETSLEEELLKLDFVNADEEKVMAINYMSPIFAPRKYSKPGKYVISKNLKSRYDGRGEMPKKIVAKHKTEVTVSDDIEFLEAKVNFLEETKQ